MRQVWNALTWAFAEIGGGQIQTDQSVAAADDFLRAAEMPAVLRLL
jgi:hypothetical protein